MKNFLPSSKIGKLVLPLFFLTSGTTIQVALATNLETRPHTREHTGALGTNPHTTQFSPQLAQTLTTVQDSIVYLGSPDSRYTISIGDQVCTECTMRVERIGDDLYIIIAPLHGEEIKYAIPEESSFCVCYNRLEEFNRWEATITGVGLQVINNQEGNKTLPNKISMGDELVLPAVQEFKKQLENVFNK